MLANNLKALIVTLPLLVVGFYLARQTFADAIDSRRIDQWRNVFVVVTIIGFLIPNYWAMLFVLALVVVVLSQNEPLRPAMYLLLLCALPPTTQTIPGFAGINNIVSLAPQSVLALTILIPRMRPLSKAGGATDMFFLLFTLLTVALSFRETSFTNGVRLSIMYFLIAVPQYYVFSRWPKSLDDVKYLMAAIAIPLLALCVVAFAEFVMRWHFYAQMHQAWLSTNIAPYSSRGGYLRAYASVSNPIVFGHMLMVALVLSLPLLSMQKKLWVQLCFLLFGAALFMTLSRGPWFGAILGVGIYVMAGPKGFSRMFQLGVVGVVTMLILLPTPIGGTIIQLLPFVGDSAGETISYRQQLLETGWRVMLDNPFFGSADYKETDEMRELIQGQGIIDIVNSYLRIGLHSGFIGLGLFLGLHFSALFTVWRSMSKTKELLPELSKTCRAFFATYIGVLFSIATTSSIAPIGIFNFILAGLSVALHRVVIFELAAVRTVTVESESTQKAEEISSKPTASAWKKNVTTETKKSVPRHLRQYIKN